MSSTIDIRNPDRLLHVGVILMGAETEILDVAPIDLLHSITEDWVKNFPTNFLGGPEIAEQAIKIHWHWVNQTGKPARLTSGINLNVTDAFDTCPPLDIALMGAHDMAYQPNEVELEFIRKTFAGCHSFLTICGGMMAPLSAGILNGKRATAPRMLLPLIRQTAPSVNWTEKRWERDGKLWTSGALLNGMDMMKAFGEEFYGAKEKGEQRLMDVMIDIGGWPERDIEYKEDEGRGVVDGLALGDVLARAVPVSG